VTSKEKKSLVEIVKRKGCPKGRRDQKNKKKEETTRGKSSRSERTPGGITVRPIPGKKRIRGSSYQRVQSDLWGREGGKERGE